MAKNKKKISVNTFEKVAKEHFGNEVIVDWYGVEVTVTPTISAVEMMNFVDDVVESAFLEDLGYMPEVFDFVVRCNVLTRYANFSLPGNIEKRYELVYGTDAFETVVQKVNPGQYDEIVRAAKEKIEYKLDTSANETVRSAEQIIATMDTMQKSVEQTLGNMSEEDIRRLANALSDDGKIEENIVKAYVNQRQEAAEEREADEPAVNNKPDQQISIVK